MGKIIRGTDEIPTKFDETEVNKLTIVGIIYESRYKKGTFLGKEYSYFTDIKLEINDIVEVPTRYGTSIGKVTRIDIPYEEIEGIEEYMKIITKKLNREEYMKDGVSN